MSIRAALKQLVWLIPWAIFARLAKGKPSIFVWPHLGLGDTISMARPLEEMSARHKKVLVACRSGNLEQLNLIFGYLGNVEFCSLGEVSLQDEPKAVLRTALRLKMWPVIGGHALFHLLWWSGASQRDFNGVLSHCLGWRGELVSNRLRDYLDDICKAGQRQFEDEEYALIDHHPGTWREIPSARIHEISSEYQIVENSTDISFESLVSLMMGASELHLVQSAPLCLALTANLGEKGRRVAYIRANFAPFARDYPLSWDQIELDGVKPEAAKDGEYRQSFGKSLVLATLVFLFPVIRFAR